MYHATKEDRDGTVAERLKELGFGEWGETRAKVEGLPKGRLWEALWKPTSHSQILKEVGGIVEWNGK